MSILLHDIHVRQILFAPERPLGRRLSLALDLLLDHEDRADQCGNGAKATLCRLVRKGLELITQPGGPLLADTITIPRLPKPVALDPLASGGASGRPRCPGDAHPLGEPATLDQDLGYDRVD